MGTTIQGVSHTSRRWILIRHAEIPRGVPSLDGMSAWVTDWSDGMSRGGICVARAGYRA